MNALKPLKQLWQKIPFSDNTRWRLTSILLKPILPFIKDGVVYTAFYREKAWREKRICPFHGGQFPILPVQDKPDIFMWGVIDWHFRIQRPQHHAQGFSKQGYRVFYISTSFANESRVGFELEPLDDTGRLFNIRLYMKGRPLVYNGPPCLKAMKCLKADLAALLDWTGSRSIYSIVQHPYWYKFVRQLPNNQLIYDCIDHHEGFGHESKGIVSSELSLLKEAALVITTSNFLEDIAKQYNDNVVVVRNGTQYEYFCDPPQNVFIPPESQCVLGYYGAIANWMDVDLLETLAKAFPDCLLLLVGSDECGAAKQLSHLTNIVFTGEVKYTQLKYYLYAMDVCLLPFKKTQLTLATNPVKVYEYLSAGKPVVSVKLPELSQFENLVLVACTHEEFIEATKQALSNSDNIQDACDRRKFAEKNTWDDRVSQMLKLIHSIPKPLTSIIIVTYNNLDLTRKCLESIKHYTDYDNIEIIVVDNASTDGSREFLNDWGKKCTNRKIILNNNNKGFAAANNQGLCLAQGQYLTLLNNDTEVTPGWIQTLIGHLHKNPNIGMVGPVTNNIGNEAKINIRYTSSVQMQKKAKQYTLKHMGETLHLHSLAFFCVMMPRHVYEKVGPLDEIYGLGFFEDDDYCRRVEDAGWKLICVDDVFIHHHLSASFQKLGKGRKELIEKNRKIYEKKWGPWLPHKYR